MSEEVFTRWIDPAIEEKDKEIERLNNIIKKFEEYLIASFNTLQDTRYLDDLMKLQEL